MPTLTRTASVRARPGESPGLATTWAKGAVGVGVLFVVLQIVSALEIVSSAYLPSPVGVVARSFDLCTDAEFVGDLRTTLSAWLVALAIGSLVGVVLGIVLGSVPVLNDLSRVAIELVRSLPAVSLIPLAILLLGQSPQMKISLAALASTWPVLFNTIYGMQDVDPIAKETSRAFGFGRTATVVRVSVPDAGPFIFTGIRTATALGLVVIVATEFFVIGSGGVGAWMILAQSGGGSAGARDVLAGTVIIGIIGVVANAALSAVESRVFAWHESQRGAGG